MSKNHCAVFTNDALGTSDATELALRLQRKEISPMEVTTAAIERLQRAATLNGLVLDTFHDALERAATARFTGEFAGVPTLMKDNTMIAGLPTVQGSQAVGNKPLKRTCQLSRQYLAQGFNLLGKSALSAFGFSASTEAEGIPPTHNPWHTDYSAGGSSGGSAALVAAGAIPIAHGNDGGGSIRIPAAVCGLVGLKCSRGRLVTQDAARPLPINIISDGVLTRSVRDTAHFFAAAEQFYRNPALPPIGRVTAPGKRRLRIGLVQESIGGFTGCEETRSAVEQTGRLLESLGHHVEPRVIKIPTRFIEDFTLYWAMLAFFVTRTGRWMFPQGFDARQLDKLTLGLEKHYRKHLTKTPISLYQLKKTEDHYRRELGGLDLVLSPVVAHTTPKLGQFGPELDFETHLGRLKRYTLFTPLHNITGAPAISLPLCTTRTGLPLGIQFSAQSGDERTLLELAFELEAAQPFRMLYHPDALPS